MIAIHYSKSSFTKRWINYCEERKISYKIVNCYENNIIAELIDCDALMWHINHASARDIQFAKQLIYSIQNAGKGVFPDYQTVWHFDDKVGQKYLLESINAPMVPTSIFYSKIDAKKWVENTTYPKVFKLRSGAGSANVRLVRSKEQARRLLRKAFGKGFKQYNVWRGLNERCRIYKAGNGSKLDIIAGLIRIIYSNEFVRISGRDKGYIYFQDYISDIDHDIRVIVIGNKAFAIKRMIRKNDFRASGSGIIKYDKNLFEKASIQLCFELAEKLKSQCVAFDLVYANKQPLVLEFSYGFSPDGYDPCPGYWDKDLNWHKGQFNPYGWMVDGLIEKTQVI